MKEKLTDRVNQLVNVTQYLVSTAITLKELHDKHMPKSQSQSTHYRTSEISTLLRFLHCTFYFDALLNLSTLLAPVQVNKDKKEQSIFELIEYELDPTMKKRLLESANNFRSKLEENNLHKWRHKLVGHKDIISAGDTEIMYLNFIKDNILTFSLTLIEEIKSFLINEFNASYNNSFANLYENGLKKMLLLLERELSAE